MEKIMMGIGIHKQVVRRSYLLQRQFILDTHFYCCLTIPSII